MKKTIELLVSCNIVYKKGGVPMKKQKSFIYFIAISILFSLSFVDAIAQPINEQIAAFRSAGTARIDVNQSWDQEEGINLPFNDVAKKFLQYSGTKVVEDLEISYELLLTINVDLKALSAEYSGVGRQYTGASIQGSIIFQLEGIPSYEKSFEGKTEPTPGVSRYAKQGKPSDAPFGAAYNRSSFKETLVKMFAEVYGIDWMIVAAKDEDWHIQEYVLAELIKIRDPRIFDSLIVFLKDEKLIEIRGQILVAMAKTGDDRALQPLIDYLKNEDVVVRLYAAQALGILGDFRAVEPLMSAIQIESYAGTREEMIKALGGIKDTRAIEFLIDFLEHDQPKVRFEFPCVTVETIALIGDTTAVNPLISILRNKKLPEDLRRCTALALGKLGDPRVVSVFINFINDLSEDDWLRYWTTRALGQNFNDDTTIDALIEFLKDEYSEVCRAAAEELKKITGKSYGKDYQLWKKWWESSK